MAAIHLKMLLISPRPQDRGHPAGFKDWLASTACSFLCCFGFCHPDTPPQREVSEKPKNRRLSVAAASTAQSNNSNGKAKTHDESLRALAAAAQGAKKDDIEISA